jgi:hypothetical protein
MKTKTYIKHFYPGVFVPEESSKPVEGRDPLKHAKEASRNVFMFMYYDIDEIDAVDEFGEKRVITSSAKNKSGKYYIDGKVFAVKDLIEANENGKYDILMDNVNCNGWEGAVLCRTGNEKKDFVILTERGTVIH